MRLPILFTTLALATSMACGGTRPKESARPEVEPTDAPVDWTKSGIDWSTPPAAGAERAFTVPSPRAFELPNGMKVLVVDNHRLPLVSIQLVIEGAGASADPKGRQGLAGLTADLLDESAAGQSALERAAELERLGAYLGTSAEPDAAVISVDGLASTLPQTLEHVAQMVAPRTSWSDFARVKGDRLSGLRRRRDSAREVASLVVDRVIFGSHMYGHPSNGYASTLNAVTESDVQGFYDAHYGPSRATLIIAGAIDATSVRAEVERAFNAWTGGELTAPTIDPLPKAPPPKLIAVDKPGAAQTELRIGRVLTTRRDRHYVPTLVADAILGGGFTSRLNRRLREELGYTYGAGSWLWHGRHSGAWYARSALKTANTIEGVREALRLIEEMRRKDVPAVELSRAKQSLVRALPRGFQRNDVTAGAFADLVTEGMPLDWYQSYRDRVDAVTIAQVRERAAASWSRDQLVVVVVGDLKVILDGLRHLGLGPVLEVDPEGVVLRTHTALE